MSLRPSPHAVANSARMVRTLHIGTIMLVEGDTDLRLYSRFVASSSCYPIPAHGKYNAIHALGLLEADRFPGVLAVVDSDFWRLHGIVPPSANILTTDTHDLETTLFASEALDKVLTELGSPSKLKRLGRPLREVVLRKTMPLGVLRWVSSPQMDNLGLNFKDLSIPAFADPVTLQINLDKMLTAVAANSPGTPIDRANVKARITSLLANASLDPLQVCCGHDLVQMLHLSLTRNCGARQCTTLTEPMLDSILRMAYEREEFLRSQLCESIRQWERGHPPYVVLA